MTRQNGLSLLLAALLLVTPAFAQMETAGTTLGSAYGLLLLSLLALSCMLAWRLRQQKRSHIGLLNALDTAGLALLSLDSERQITHLNNNFLALGGVPHGTQSLHDLPADWRNWLDKHVQQALEQGKSVAEERVFTPDENRPAMLLRLSAARLNDARGQAGVLLWCENISASNEIVSTALEREHTLRTRSQSFIQTLIDVIPRPVYVKDSSGRYILANKSFYTMYGTTQTDVIGHTAAELSIDATQAQAIALEDARVMAGAPIFKEEFSASPDKAGEDRFTIVSKQSCLNPEGHRVLVGTHIDITPWRIAERELHASLKREQQRNQRTQLFVQRLLDVFPNPVYLKDAQSRYVMINEAFVLSRGKTREELLNLNALQVAQAVVTRQSGLMPEAERRASASQQEDLAVLAGTPLRKEESNIKDQNGVLHDRIVTKTACEDPDGRMLILVSLFDITAMRNAQRELSQALQAEMAHRQRTQDFIQRLIDALPLPVCVRDRDSRHLHVNASFLNDAGLTREQIIGQRITDFISNAERVKISLREDQEILAGQDILEERQDPGLSGQELRDLIISKRSCLDVDGQPVIVVAQINVTAQREAERRALSLMNNEKSLRTATQDFIQRLIDIIPHPFFVKDQEGRYILANEALAKEFQRPAAEILGRETREIYADPERARAILEEDKSVLAGTVIYEERHEASPPGSNQWTDRIVSKRCCLDVDGRPVIAVSHFDVSEFRSVQRKLEAAMQRESIQVDRMREFLQRVIDVIPQEFYIKDADSRILMVNPVYLRRRGLSCAAEAIERTAPEIGDAFLTNNPALRDNPEAMEEARLELRKSWEVAQAEDLEVLAGKTVLKEVTRWMPGSDAAHAVVIAKAACTDISGRQVIVCASYDISDLRDTMRQLEKNAANN